MHSVRQSGMVPSSPRDPLEPFQGIITSGAFKRNSSTRFPQLTSQRRGFNDSRNRTTEGAANLCTLPSLGWPHLYGVKLHQPTTLPPYSRQRVMYSMTLLAALLFPAVTTAVPSLGDRVVAGFATQLHLPLSVSEATDAGWTSVTGDPKACDAVSGRRFRLGELLTPTLVFDNTGGLAGVQIVVNETTYPSYPQSNRRPSGGWFTATGDHPATSSMSLHFKDPAKLCSAEAADDVTSAV